MRPTLSSTMPALRGVGKDGAFLRTDSDARMRANKTVRSCRKHSFEFETALPNAPEIEWQLRHAITGHSAPLWDSCLYSPSSRLAILLVMRIFHTCVAYAVHGGKSTVNCDVTFVTPVTICPICESRIPPMQTEAYNHTPIAISNSPMLHPPWLPELDDK
ncbi:hypothetical protein EDD85DRAFT_280043 [Armillaria nabsnona]|nr:hypothetical protein EDD85DRAFT_280043 [Armillaria nabsnona]